MVDAELRGQPHALVPLPPPGGASIRTFTGERTRLVG